VICFAEQFGNRAAEREFGILESSVIYWKKQKEALRNTKSDSRAFRGPKPGKYPALEDELLTYNFKVCHPRCVCNSLGGRRIVKTTQLIRRKVM